MTGIGGQTLHANLASSHPVILNLFSFAGLRLRIHLAEQAAVDGQKWILNQVQDDAGREHKGSLGKILPDKVLKARAKRPTCCIATSPCAGLCP
ncbi:MAG: hypothetical protein DI555_18660 [Novosphingobium pentaromativorans]|uniref:Uncharacterized protein n=1 Tax=Novosphingobium pentaromativorans TaxID=205844 RepID=A0A2W5NJP1_9SPHN|nr:MAG: hypothetical protein DI555_18660 [Novosphingobium pentaromativorans]